MSLAGALPSLLVVCAACVLCAACVVPLPAEIAGADGGADYPPVVVASNPPMPGMFTISKDTYTVDVQDGDAADTIYVRVFRDYNPDAATPFFNDATVPNAPGGSLIRHVALQNNTWCSGATSGQQFVFDVVVADRPFNDSDLSVPRPYQTAPGAQITHAFWVASCP